MNSVITVETSPIEGQTNSVRLNVTGRYFRCREASAAFQLKVNNEVFTLEGGDELTIPEGDEPFKQLVFTNLSSTEELTVDFIAGLAVVSTAYNKLPRTRMVGHNLELANNEETTFAGLDEFGKRRKQFTITLKPGTAATDYVLVYDDDEGTLLAIISQASSGAGFAIETDANIRIVNKTGSTVESTSDTPDIAVAETFYR